MYNWLKHNLYLTFQIYANKITKSEFKRLKPDKTREAIWNSYFADSFLIN